MTAKKKPRRARSAKSTRPTKPAPEKRQRTKPDWAPKFLAALALVPNISHACLTASIDRDTFYERKKREPAFLRKVRQAFAIGVDRLEKEMWRRAVDGTTEVVTSGGKPAYVFVDADGNQVAPEVDAEGDETMPAGAKLAPLVLRRYSDTLAIFLAKAHRPKKFRDNYKLEVTGKDGAPIEMLARKSTEELQAWERILDAAIASTAAAVPGSPGPEGGSAPGAGAPT